MIRHQMTGSGLHTLSFRGAEAKSRYLPTLRRSLQAVKKHMPSCQAPSCLMVISTKVEKSPHPILPTVSDKKAHTVLSGAVKK